MTDFAWLNNRLRFPAQPTPRPWARIALPTVVLAALVACGGGGGGSGGGGGGGGGGVTYTVGGPVIGLTSSGLVLQNNGGDDLAVSPSSAFTFATGLATGAAYAVTVKTQPSVPAQYCGVSNGSGTVGTANITDVAVQCYPSEGYTVGGTVTGLKGSGLVLVGQGTDLPPVSVAVSAAGTFTFPMNFAAGTTYSVGVGQQPASPTQLCTVVNGTGTIGSANVTDVSVMCEGPGRFAYAANAGDNTISSYSIDPMTGALTSIGTPVATGTSPFAITGSPNRKHLYVVNQVSNDISAYEVDDTTGALTPISGSPFAAGTDPQALAFDPSGAYLYVANRGSDNLSAYAVDANSGALTLLPTPSYPTGPGPSAVLVEPSGPFLYVANNGGSNNVSSFAITEGTGELTPVAGSPFGVLGSPHSLARLGHHLFTANGPSITSSWIIGGGLSRPSGHDLPATNYLATARVGSVLFVAAGPGLDVYSFDPDSGALFPAISVPGAPGANVYSATFDPSDHFLYVCNDGAANVSGYTWVDGALTPIPGSPFAAGSHPDFIAVL